MKVGTKKTNALYGPLYDELIEDYKTQCIAVLTLASSMCWVPVDTSEKDITKRKYMCKLTPDRALYEIEPAIKGLLLAVQRKMELSFPTHLVEKIAKFGIEKEILDIEETTGGIKKSLKR